MINWSFLLSLLVDKLPSYHFSLFLLSESILSYFYITQFCINTWFSNVDMFVELHILISLPPWVWNSAIVLACAPCISFFFFYCFYSEVPLLLFISMLLSRCKLTNIYNENKFFVVLRTRTKQLLNWFRNVVFYKYYLC